MPRDSVGCGSVADRLFGRRLAPDIPQGEPRTQIADRAILHVDMDAFFASVEVLDDPRLTGRPVIVGGTGMRGVVAACTYEARRFGVHSAMPSVTARRLCPEAVFVEGRYQRYVEESEKLHSILDEVSPLVEGISLDEAFVDVSGCERLAGDGRTIAMAVRERVHGELHLTCSVGVGRSKLIAKLASKEAKPMSARSGIRPGRGVVVVPAEGELAFLHPLPVSALWGVGPVTARKLEGLGVRTVGDLAAIRIRTLQRHLGKSHGTHLADLAQGKDQRPVVPDRDAKSVGHEETFPVDLVDADLMKDHLARLTEVASAHLRSAGLAARRVTIKIRFGDFSLVTRSHSLTVPIDSVLAVRSIVMALFESVERQRGVRLLGVSLSGFVEDPQGVQLSLDLDAAPRSGAQGPGKGNGAEVQGEAVVSRVSEATDRMAQAHSEAERLQQSWSGVTSTVDAIRARYGRSAVGPASLVGPDGLRVRRRGEAQWGPSDGKPPDLDNGFDDGRP